MGQGRDARQTVTQVLIDATAVADHPIMKSGDPPQSIRWTSSDEGAAQAKVAPAGTAPVPPSTLAAQVIGG
jgi:hypothetical protein